MKTPKYIVALMLAILVGVWLTLRSSQELGKDLQKNRINEDILTALNMKANTFTTIHKVVPPKPTAPKWGTFKTTTTETVAQVVDPDANRNILETLVKKASDKLKKPDAKKKKVAAKKKPTVKLIASNNSRVERALRRLDDGFGRKSGDIIPLVAAGVAPVPLVEVIEEEKEKTKLTYSQWQALLFTQDEKAVDAGVTKLLEAYGNNELADRNWAFSLAQQMIEDQNPTIELGGVKILNSLPSTQSFTILVSQSKHHSEAVNLELEKSLDVYARQISMLPILEASVRSSDPLVQTEAARLIEESARRHLLVADQPRNRRDPRESGAPKTTAQRYVTSLEAIKLASQRANDPEVKSILDQTANNLSAIISKSNIA